MTNQEKNAIRKASKDLFTPEYLRPYANVFGEAIAAIEDFVAVSGTTMSGCEELYMLLEEKCHYATQGTCVEVRQICNNIAGVFAGSEPCEACYFNQFCSYAVPNNWHSNMINISDRLLEIYRFNDEVTQDDIDYINTCFDAMEASDEYQRLHILLDNWS